MTARPGGGRNDIFSLRSLCHIRSVCWVCGGVYGFGNLASRRRRGKMLDLAHKNKSLEQLQMKFCKDCKWYSQFFYGFWIFKKECPELSKCAHPTLLSPINNRAVKFCEFVRKKDKECGLDAKLFECRKWKS